MDIRFVNKSFSVLLLMILMIGLPSLYPIFALAPEEQAPPALQTRTLTFFLFQETATLASGSSVTRNANIFIGDQSPVVKDAFVEVRGVTKQAASQTITLDIRSTSGSVCTETFATPRERAFTVNASGKDTRFKLLYTGNGSSGVSSLVYCLGQIITVPSGYSFDMKIAVSGADVSLASARLVVTYQFTPSAAPSSLPAIGTLISPTFDTYAVNGANFNWILWKGLKPAGTQVRLQFASADASGGPFTYAGPDCSAATYYEPAADTAVEIRCLATHNNKRYFRYRVQLCSSSDCATPGTQNPEVTDVIVNWSP